MSENIKMLRNHVTMHDYLCILKSRIGFKRDTLKIEPGLYSLNNPTSDAHVYVTANYIPSVIALKQALKKMDCYILVLDTKGVNVWCAAGKGTFGTKELIYRIRETKLNQIIHHNRIILPQLSAPGVCAHEVLSQTGFKVNFGPVRAKDIPKYLENSNNSAIRKMDFTLKDRIVLIPVELVQTFIPILIFSILFFLIGGVHYGVSFIIAVYSALILFPFLLPVLPTSNFSTKGFILGCITLVPAILSMYISSTEYFIWEKLLWIVSLLLVMPNVTAFISLNFTGSSTITSWTGVKKEIQHYIPVMIRLAVPGIIIAVGLRIVSLFWR